MAQPPVNRRRGLAKRGLLATALQRNYLQIKAATDLGLRTHEASRSVARLRRRAGEAGRREKPGASATGGGGEGTSDNGDDGNHGDKAGREVIISFPRLNWGDGAVLGNKDVRPRGV